MEISEIKDFIKKRNLIDCAYGITPNTSCKLSDLLYLFSKECFKDQSSITITPANLIEQLMTATIRIWMAEDVKRLPGATDKQIADATRITNITNQQRHNLIQEIDKAFGHNTHQGDMKIYGTEETKRAEHIKNIEYMRKNIPYKDTMDSL